MTLKQEIQNLLSDCKARDLKDIYNNRFGGNISKSAIRGVLNLSIKKNDGVFRRIRTGQYTLGRCRSGIGASLAGAERGNFIEKQAEKLSQAERVRIAPPIPKKLDIDEQFQDFIDKNRQCKVKSRDRDERDVCFGKLNDEVMSFVQEKWNLYPVQNLKDKMFGTFLIDTLRKTGQTFKDIRKIGPVDTRGEGSVVPITTDGGKFFIKTGGTTTEANEDAYENLKEAGAIASLLKEEVPQALNFDFDKNIIAVSGIPGEKAHDGRVDDSTPATEMADVIMFETLIGSWDRWNNVIEDFKSKKDIVLGEIDFDEAGEHFKSYHSQLSQSARNLVKEAIEGKVSPNMKRALQKNVNWYWKHRKELAKVAPNVYFNGKDKDGVNVGERKKDTGQKMVDKRVLFLAKAFKLDPPDFLPIDQLSDAEYEKIKTDVE